MNDWLKSAIERSVEVIAGLKAGARITARDIRHAATGVPEPTCLRAWSRVVQRLAAKGLIRRAGIVEIGYVNDVQVATTTRRSTQRVTLWEIV